jgi:prolyl-tRNA synthetase
VRFSQLYAPTLKETPADAEVISHELLVRGGFIRKVAAGVFTYLPLGKKVLKKIEEIVREEMDRVGCQEILMPIIQPSDMWKTTGRWEDYGPEMMKLIDRHDREFTLGPTHEEMVTTTVKHELYSYKSLPVNLYQIYTKYRDEIRPRFGLLRAREFIMKDAYSFHTSMEDLHKTYQVMYQAYANILKRMGLKYMVVEADTGAIGGSCSHEFNILAENGESHLFYCPKCGYSASDEKAEYFSDDSCSEELVRAKTRVSTPGVKTIEQVSAYLKTDSSKIVKSLLFKGRSEFIMVLIRGDREINLSKLRAITKDQTLELAQPEDVLQEFGVPIGFIGPSGIKKTVTIIGDLSVKNLKNVVIGGMETDFHYVDANEGRDFTVTKWHDVRMVEKGDRCPHCQTPMEETLGIEMGHIFELGTKYSEKLEACYIDEKGESKPFVMGCYGWGVSRTIAGIVEQLHDEKGIIWPVNVAPFRIIITVVNYNDAVQKNVGERLYRYFLDKGAEVLLDDRLTSAGSKFNDADLTGIPIRITVGKAVATGSIEMKKRYEKEAVRLSIEDGFEKVYQRFESMIGDYAPGV